MKTCPHCAESIQDAAKVCPHCRRDLKLAQPHLAARLGCLGVIALIMLGWCVGRPPASRSTSTPGPVASSAPAPVEKEPKPADRKSPTCRRISGETTADLDHLEAFCAAAIPKGLQIVGARAFESLVWIQINRELADTMRADRLSTESVVKTWMAQWRAALGKGHAVTVYVQWQDIEIAKGDTSLLSGDVVTVK